MPPKLMSEINTNMNIIIPIGGIGNRFKTQGYQLPKPLINIHGDPMIKHVLNSIQFHPDDNVIIIYNKELYNHGFEELIRSFIQKNIFMYQLHECTTGAVHTLHSFLKSSHDLSKFHKRTAVFDCDTFYHCNILDKIRNIDSRENCVICFESLKSEPIFSYVSFDDSHEITAIKEKHKISNYANTGCYVFADIKELRDYCKIVLDTDHKFSNEHYTSCVIDKMIADSKPFKAVIIKPSDFTCVGTPEQLKQYCSSIVSPRPLRMCFDIDATLFYCPKKDYSNPVPINRNILYLKVLKSLGHVIILHTARRMLTSGGCEGKAIKDIGMITLQTLEKYGIPYDEIYFGKPYADFYIDDKAVYSNSDLEKQVGIYTNSVQERSFNSIQTECMEVIVKRGPSKKIAGEVFYYMNIPQDLSNLFPILISHNEMSYITEKIIGINMSYSYVRNEVNVKMLTNLLQTLHRIHEHKPTHNTMHDDIKQLIYKHYLTRLDERRNAIHKEGEIIHAYFEKFFHWYANENKAILGMIHGDPVLTNILIQEDKYKFIDMRGVLHNEYCIYGDTIYDFAKVYQSLLGYDEIMHDVFIQNNDASLLRHTICDFIEKTYGREYITILKIIGYAHLYTLLPLHPIDKAIRYASLIDVDALREYVSDVVSVPNNHNAF